MSDPSYALQKAQELALLADSATIALVGESVFDDLSAPNSAYPRICIGDDQVIGDTNTCFDPSEVYSTVHIWAAGPGGRMQAKEIASEVRRVLAQKLTLTGHTVLSGVFHDARYLIDTDETDAEGRVAHGVLTFHYYTTPSA